MKYVIFSILILSSSLVGANNDPQKTKVILLGVFHFHNPGADAAKFEDVDIFSKKSQEEIEKLTQVIASLKPAKIMLESNKKRGEEFDEILETYSSKTLSEYKNEIIQIGFRLKSKLPESSVHYVDHEMGLPFDSLMQTWKNSGQQKYYEDFMTLIRTVEDEFNEQTKQGMTITDRLKFMNTEDYRNFSLAPYTRQEIMDAGEEGNYIGADVASDWYKRNIRIFSNIIRELNGDEDCIFIMFGASHIPILEHLFRLHDNKYELVNINDIL
jgi:hypothetical protein